MSYYEGVVSRDRGRFEILHLLRYNIRLLLCIAHVSLIFWLLALVGHDSEGVSNKYRCKAEADGGRAGHDSHRVDRCF